jgi:hypothetical protein
LKYSRAEIGCNFGIVNFDLPTQIDILLENSSETVNLYFKLIFRNYTTKYFLFNSRDISVFILTFLKAVSPHDSVEFVDHFSIYFLHDPLDFIFTLAENLAKLENFLILSRSR